MINFMIHTPVNSRGRITAYVRGRLPDIEKRIGDKVKITSPHDYEKSHSCTESWLNNCIAEETLPDIMLTHAGEFSALGTRKMDEYFMASAASLEQDHPIREQLSMLRDPKGFFYPVAVVPLVMSYNAQNVDNKVLTNSWSDLFLDRLKVIIPDKSKPITKELGAYIMRYLPEYFDRFEHLDYLFSPAEVIKIVAAGEYDMCITNITFSMMMKNRSIRTNHAKEGVLLLPQVLVLKKGADERHIRLASTVLEDDIQNYMGAQGFFTSNANAVMGEAIAYDGMLKNWNGWESYIQDIVDYEHTFGEAS